MIQATDILARRNEIKNCIAAADMERAVKRLIDFTNEFFSSEEDGALIISMEYYHFYRKEMTGTIRTDEEILHKRIVAERILKMLRFLTQSLVQTP